MKKYDVIIIGAGIAGTSLAYNLKRINYPGKILLIDRNKIGHNSGYGYRNTFKEIIEEYNFPYVKKYSNLKMGDFQGIKLDIDVEFYLVDYEKICNHLFKKNPVDFKKEEALHVSGNMLTTNKENYYFKYLIDASGSTFFLKKLFSLPLPFRYYLGRLKKFQTKKQDKSNTVVYYSDKKGYVEDFCQIEKKIIQGDWQISDKVDFRKIDSPKYSKLNNLNEKLNLLEKSNVFYPVTPAFPLVYKNCAFLGDSFGNATPSLGEGIRPITESSKILAVCILKDNLKKYEEIWRKKYLDKYLKTISSRLKLKNRFEILKIAKENPKILSDVIKGGNPKLKLKQMKKIPKKIILNWIFSYLYLKIKYNSFFRKRYN